MKSPLPSAMSLSFEGHRPYLYRYALSRVRHKETADDVVQDTLMAALEGQAHFRGHSSLRTWLIGILKHKVTDYHRRQANAPDRIRDLAPADLDDEYDEAAEGFFTASGDWITPPSSWPSPDQSFENARFWETFERCLAALPPTVGRAFYLREIQGTIHGRDLRGTGDYSKQLLCMLYRARMSLRQGLHEHWFEPAAKQ